MAGRIRLQVVTPSGTALDRRADYVRIPLPEGSLGVLADHAPMLCTVAKGTLRLRDEDGESSLAVGRGVARVENNEVTLLVEAAD